MREEDDVLISRYLAGELTNEEFQAFEDRLPRDPGLKAALRDRRQEMTFLRSEALRPDLDAKMAELAAAHFAASESPAENAPPEKEVAKEAPEARIRPMRRRTWWAVASVAAAVVLVLMLWNPFAGIGEDPYRQFASYQPVYLTEKSSEVVSSAQAAETAFNGGDYAAAYNELTNYLRERPEDNEARLARGIAALETERTDEAMAIFRELAEGNTSFQTDGQYYLGLAQLKTGDLATAKATFQAIPIDDPDYGARRRAVLGWLER
ncbi:tetratricopeptide repeat protein [Neolewinella agarilytica]|uniref:Tetratricopeptide repeat-containing protein n=1 Tax=Neolewinella agarilytica TaxID=478744 RepID=A0A1H9MN93_9BACT|nr:tetratricopeptide repeat protein [Neolewinella agarilytica]SER24989.1 Tetratricopeptide repeat-containing protein [Neolewinella agarilytica]